MASYLGSDSRSAPQAPSARHLSLLGGALVSLLLLLTGAAIAVAFFMATDETIQKDTLRFEIGKLVAQAGIITGFGALLTLLVHEFQQDQEDARKRVAAESQKLADRHAWLRDFATKLTVAYGEVKQSRRRLQWTLETVGSERSISAKVYENQLKRLNEIQTEFESLHTIAQMYLPDNAKTIPAGLQFIIDELSAVISERKTIPPNPQEESERISLTEREVIRCFTANSKEKEFAAQHGFDNMKNCYKGILRGMRDELHRAEASMSVPRQSWRDRMAGRRRQ